MFVKIMKKFIVTLMIIFPLIEVHAHEDVSQENFALQKSLLYQVWDFIEEMDEAMAPVEAKYDRSKYDTSFWSFFNNIDKGSRWSYLSRLMDEKSQREDWFAVNSYIAEFWCFTSNLAILGVGLADKSWYTILAGTMSGISHAIPTKFAHDLDRIGVAAVVGVCVLNYEAILASPETLGWGMFAGVVHGIDAIVSRKYGSKAGAKSHSGWHLSGAIALHYLNMTLDQYFKNLKIERER